MTADEDCRDNYSYTKCVCGHFAYEHQYSDGTYKSFCDECVCKSFRDPELEKK